MNIDHLVLALDYASVAIFALTGALVASRGQLDVVGFIFFAVLTGVGGGTLRDLVLGRVPVFWIGRPELLLLTSGAAIVVFFTAHRLENRFRAIQWLDACALAVAVPAGVGVALGVGVSPIVTVLMGVMTGTFGGLMRDVVGNEVPMVLRKGELYITATFGGAVAALVVLAMGAELPSALFICGVVVLGLRAGSMVFGWRLPVYRPRPRRNGL
ncbi:trimeric intracellular cation channel family protein [Paracoccus sp. (in: a-proteobacteria)]|uniref:trimeric intracellular cation channel family protein n=1 Tax=Paracoccus sp. TaxID=267 RepID=UPI0032201527